MHIFSLIFRQELHSVIYRVIKFWVFFLVHDLQNKFNPEVVVVGGDEQSEDSKSATSKILLSTTRFERFQVNSMLK